MTAVMCVLAGAGTAVAKGGSAAAKGGAKGAGPIVKLKFQRVPGYLFASSSGKYVFLERSNSTAGTLIDEQAGGRMEVNRPNADCTSIPELSHQWLQFVCGDQNNPRAELYSLTSHKWTSVTVAASIGCPPLFGGGCGLAFGGAGASWIPIILRCYHCVTKTVYQNIATGQVVADPTNNVTVPNVDSAALGQRVCDPLRVPASKLFDYGGTNYTAYGRLDFAGSFAFVTKLRQLKYYGEVARTIYIERCGSSLHERLCSDCSVEATSTHFVLWKSGSGGRVHAIRLPSKKRLRIQYPTKKGYWSGTTLSSRHLYMVRDNGHGKHTLFMSRIP